jgi:hypothetical protein
VYAVYCAVRQDTKVSPAEQFLDLLSTNSLPDDPVSELHPDEQPSVHGWFLHTFQSFADTGIPPYSGAVNYLEDGIWEFKRRNKRMTFYDTNGSGDYTPKSKIRDWADRDSDDLDWWWFPNFDPENLRLGHSFLKASEQTSVEDLSMATEVRKEDLKNDQP